MCRHIPQRQETREQVLYQVHVHTGNKWLPLCVICTIIYMQTHSYVWHDSFIRVWHDSFICVTWLLHKCDITLSYAWHDTFICVTLLIHMCEMTPLYDIAQHLWHWREHHLWHDSFTRVTWPFHKCDTTDFVWNRSALLTWKNTFYDEIHSCMRWLIRMWDMTHWHVTPLRDMTH